jgi:pimeloyl-ACP methyl ester carboxylesterase
LFAKDIHHLIEYLGCGPTVLVGHSVGVRVVLQAAVNRPELTAGIVLVDGSRQATGTEEEVENKLSMKFDGDVANLSSQRFMDMFFDNADIGEKERIIGGVRSVTPEMALALTRATWRWDAIELERVLGEIRVPTQVIQSTYSDDEHPRRMLSVGDTTPWIDRIRSYIPDAKIEIVPGVGHFTMLEAPDHVNTVIHRFAESL